jgi:uncharacterized membrane protein YdcZ (DUF606 family)
VKAFFARLWWIASGGFVASGLVLNEIIAAKPIYYASALLALLAGLMFVALRSNGWPQDHG